MRGLAVLVLVVAASACNGGSSSEGGAACRAAGGQCYVGSAAVACAKQGPEGCESDPATPAGLFCCIAFVDAGDGG